MLAFASSHAQTWTSFASVPNGFVSDHTGLPRRIGYLVAGQTPNASDNVYKYNPDSDTWSTLADFPARRADIPLATPGTAKRGWALGWATAGRSTTCGSLTRDRNMDGNGVLSV